MGDWQKYYGQYYLPQVNQQLAQGIADGLPEDEARRIATAFATEYMRILPTVIARAVLEILRLRGIAVTPVHAERIAGCTCMAQAFRWKQVMLKVSSAYELLNSGDIPELDTTAPRPVDPVALALLMRFGP